MMGALQRPCVFQACWPAMSLTLMTDFKTRGIVPAAS